MARDNGKLCSIEAIADVSAGLQRQGKKVVLAHGVFDLLHLGHLRHLEAARNCGDVLIVSISGDRVVHKGPGRPVFQEHLRAEMLAALSVVDYVCICSESGASLVIEAIRPNVYAKGSEYRHAHRDPTGRIAIEQALVERHGGKIVFTDDVTYSSSTLLNKFFEIYPPELKAYLDSVRDEKFYDALLAMLERIKSLKVLLVGECILDEYQYVVPMGKSAKENIIATRHVETEVFCGGVIAAANHVAGFCSSVDVAALMGTQDSHEEFVRRSLKPNVNLVPFYRDDGPTVRKRRMVDPSYTRKLFEVCYLAEGPVDGEARRHLDSWLEGNLRRYDVVIVADFGHGMIEGSTIDILARHAPFLAVNAQSNSANLGYNLVTKYPRADYVCIDQAEARLAARDRWTELDRIVEEVLVRNIDCAKVAVTAGQQGCLTFQRDEGLQRIPAFTRSVVDTMGAGDAFLSITAPLASVEKSMRLVGFVGNAAGALKVSIVGHRQAIDRGELIKYITAMLK